MEATLEQTGSGVDTAKAFDELAEHALVTLDGEEQGRERFPGPALLSAPFRATAFLAEAAANVYDLTLGDDGTEPAPKPSLVVDSGPQRTLRRYPPRSGRSRGSVLLVPPLGGSAACFDLRPGASLIDHLTWSGRTAYVVDYGSISFADRGLGLEHWVLDVVPQAIRAAAEDAGEPVHTAGWCLGGIMSMLAVAAEPRLPARTLTLVASPFDFSQVPIFSPIRAIGEYTGGAIGTAFYRALGGIPAPLVSIGFRLTAIDRYVTRPLFIGRNLANREALTHMRAVDHYMARMHRYPGRSLGQIYHSFFWGGHLAEGRFDVDGRTLELDRVSLPVLAVAGKSDVLAPPPAVHHVGDLLGGSSEVRLETAPGGHLGVLSGMGARRSTWAHLEDFMTAHGSAT